MTTKELVAISAMNLSDVACLKQRCLGFRCECVKKIIDALLAENENLQAEVAAIES
jgi:hypothetical protein